MWGQWLIAAVVVIIAVCGFVSFVKLQTHRLSDPTDNTADDVYDRYADSLPKQRRFARSHRGGWRSEE